MPDTPNASRVVREKAQVNDPSCSADFADNTYWESKPQTPASRVEEVLAHIKGVKHNVGTEPRTYYLAEQADLDALIAAVRAEERAKADRELTALGNGLTDATALLLKDERAAVRSDVLVQVRERVKAYTVVGKIDGERRYVVLEHELDAALADLAEGKP